MSTTANIQFQKREYSISHDGYLNAAIPMIKEMVDEARKYAEDHNMGFEQAMWIVLQKKQDEGTIRFDGFDHPNHEYMITDRGDILFLSDDEITWKSVECLKEDYQTIVTAVELDDVDCSLSTMHARNHRMGEIQDMLPGELIEEWEDEVYKRLEDPRTTMASGAKYN